MSNKKVAGAIVAIVMLLFVFVGSYRSFDNLRSDALDAFHGQISPSIGEAMVHAFNMQTVAARYLDTSQIDSIGIGRIVDNIESAERPQRIYEYYVQLNLAVWKIYDTLVNVPMSQENQNFINDFHANFLEMDDILRLSGYNNLAREFNTALSRTNSLGFLIRPIIGKMQQFDLTY